MALVDNNKIEEIVRQLFESFLVFLGSSNRLIQRQINLIGRIEVAQVTLVIALPKGLKSFVSA